MCRRRSSHAWGDKRAEPKTAVRKPCGKPRTESRAHGGCVGGRLTGGSLDGSADGISGHARGLTGLSGLSEQEAARRLAARGRPERLRTSRSYASIVRANVFTVFNVILAGFGTVTLIFGDWRDALFLGVIVANSAIGITQETRAKRALDRLSLLVAPSALVVRDGVGRAVPVAEIVPGDVVMLAPGDQLVGRREAARGEGAASGRVDPQRRVRAGHEGAGGGGALGGVRDGWHGRLRGHRGRRRELRGATHRSGAVVSPSPLAAAARDRPAAVWAGRARDRARRAPRILALSPSRARAHGGGHIGGRCREPDPRGSGGAREPHLCGRSGAHVAAWRAGAATQRDRVASVGGHDLRGQDRHPHRGGAAGRRGPPSGRHRGAGLRAVLGTMAASASNAELTMRAIADAVPGAAPRRRSAEVPFSSRRRWSAVGCARGASCISVRRSACRSASCASARERQHRGRRVLAVARGREPLPAQTGELPPADLEPLGLVVLAEELRPGVAGDDCVPASRGGRGEGALGRRCRRRSPRSRATSGVSVAGVSDGQAIPDDPLELAALRGGGDGRGTDLPGGQAGNRAGARRRGPLRGDGRRRRQRRTGAEELAAGDRTGRRHADGAQRRGPRARHRRLRTPCRCS